MLDALLVLVFAALLIAEVVSVARMQDGAGTRLSNAPMVLLAVFVITHRALAALQRRMVRPGSRRALGAVKWGLAITLPLIVGGAIERRVHEAHVARVQRVVELVRSRIAAAVARGGPVSPRDLQGIEEPFLQGVQVHRASGAFVLRAALPAVDIDGYTAVYSSAGGRLRVWHNDRPEAGPPDLTPPGDVMICAGGSPLRCE